MKARITIRQDINTPCYTLINGDVQAAGIHPNDMRKGSNLAESLLFIVERLKGNGCDYSANKILKCIRFS